MNTTDKAQRLDTLIEAWHTHIQQTPGHTPPATEGGSARYDTNLAATYICCFACDWDHSLPERYKPQ